MNTLLIEATKKLIALSEQNDWKDELLEKAPPVLWFGNSNSNKEKILTLGANPSRREFFTNKQEHVYIDLQKRRFKHLTKDQNYSDILTNIKLQKEIVSSFNDYFIKKPYATWFGGKNNSPGKVEGFLRGFDASFYENKRIKYQALHIDLFPFATKSNFKEIRLIVERDVLSSVWSKDIVDLLLREFKPKVIFVFGITNFKILCKYYSINRGNEFKFTIINNKGYECTCNYWLCRYKGYQIVGLSKYLANPIRFDSQALNQLGMEINGKLRL